MQKNSDYCIAKSLLYNPKSNREVIFCNFIITLVLAKALIESLKCYELVQNRIKSPELNCIYVPY